MRKEGSELLSARMKNKRGAKSHKNEENKVKLTFYQLYLVSKYKTSNREQLSLKINRDFTVSRTNLKDSHNELEFKVCHSGHYALPADIGE